MMNPDFIAKVFSEFTPGAAGIWTIAIMLVAYMAREWRESRKLSLSDRLARREGYAKQVESLLVENRKLRDEITRAREDQDEYRRLCRAETDQLRNQVMDLMDQVLGFKRARAADAAADKRIEGASLDVQAAAGRTADHRRGRDKPE